MRGKRIELLDYRRLVGKWRAYYLTAEGVAGSFPAEWTDLGPKDPFVEQAQGQAIARVEDLLELARITAEGVNGITPGCKVK